MGQFKPMVKMMTTEPTVELKLKKGGTVKGHKNMKSGGCMKSGGKADASGHSYMNGGVSAALAGEPMIAPKRRRIASAPVGKPSMAARRAAMAGAKAGARAGAKQGALASMMGGMKEGGETSKEHKAEMSKMKGLAKELKSHESKPASKAHKGLKTGGVAMGQGGYKTGGVVKGQGGYKDGGIIRSTTGVTKVNTATADHSPAKTGDVKLGKAGGYKKGGSAKKFAEGGSVQDGGRPQKMAQGAKKPSSAVSIDKLSGTFKKGGKVASKKLQAVFKKENAPAMKAAKADSNLKYSKYQKMQKFADGGTVDATGRPVGNMPPPIPEEMMTRGNPLPPEANMYSGPKRIPDNENMPMPNKGNLFAGVQPTREVRTRLNFNPPPQFMNTRLGSQLASRMQRMPARPYKKGGEVKGYAGGGMSDYEQYMSPEEQLKEMRMRKAMNEGYEGVAKRDTEANEALLESLSSLPRSVKNMVKKAMRGSGAVTDTERTVSRTVVPAKKRGGKVRK